MDYAKHGLSQKADGARNEANVAAISRCRRWIPVVGCGRAARQFAFGPALLAGHPVRPVKSNRGSGRSRTLRRASRAAMQRNRQLRLLLQCPRRLIKLGVKRRRIKRNPDKADQGEMGDDPQAQEQSFTETSLRLARARFGQLVKTTVLLPLSTIRSSR